MHSNTIAEERLRIDQQTNDLLAQVYELKRRHNALSPACRLPPEILCAILIDCRDQGLCYDPSLYHDLSWIPIATRVCASWRAAAMSYPALWEHVEYAPTRPSIGPWMATLAQNRPLHVAIRFKHTFISAETFKEDVLRRTVTLHMCDFPPHLKDADAHESISTLWRPAPALEVLGISGGDDDHLNCTLIPAGLLSDHAPNLRSVEFVGTSLNWTTLGFLRTVEHLFTNICRSDNTTHELIGALNGMPNLRSLDMGLIMSASSEPPTLEVDLPFLTELKLRENEYGAEFIADLLPAFVNVIPHLNRCELHPSWRGLTHLTRLVDFSRCISQCLATRCIGIHALKMGLIDFALSTSETRHFCEDENNNEHFTFLLMNEDLTSFLWMRPLAEVFDFTPLRHLEIMQPNSELIIDACEHLIPNIPSLHTLILEGVYLEGNRPPFILWKDMEAGPFFPSLRRVEISSGVPLMCITDWLTYRHRQGLGVETFVLRNCQDRCPSVTSRDRNTLVQWVAEIRETPDTE
jgi:hypothetical protein